MCPELVPLVQGPAKLELHRLLLSTRSPGYQAPAYAHPGVQRVASVLAWGLFMQAGTVIAGKYRLSRRLGQGAMGVVWAAVHELTERQVALKLIPRWNTENEEVRRRLLREARACGRGEARHGQRR